MIRLMALLIPKIVIAILNGRAFKPAQKSVLDVVVFVKVFK